MESKSRDRENEEHGRMTEKRPYGTGGGVNMSQRYRRIEGGIRQVHQLSEG